MLTVIQDSMAARNLAAPLAVALLDDGDLRAVGVGLELLDNPNVIDEHRYALVGSLTRRNASQALAEAEHLLGILDGEALTRLARNVARAGTAGSALLVAMLTPHFSGDRRLAASAALLEAPESEIADIARAHEALSQIRESAETPVDLLRRAFLAVPGVAHALTLDQATSLLSPVGAADLRASCIGVVGASDHVEQALAVLQADDVEQWGIPWRKVMAQVDRGKSFVERVVATAEIPWAVRYRALGALAEADPAAAAAKWHQVSDDTDHNDRDRTAVMLAGFGCRQVLSLVLTQLSTSWTAYEALHGLLTLGTGLTRAEVRDAIAAASQGPRRPSHSSDERQYKPITLDDLRGIGHEPASAVEASLQVRWCNDQVIERVGARFMRTMLPSQIEQYERALEDGAEVGRTWLARYFPEQSEVEEEERQGLLDRVKADPSLLPKASRTLPQAPLELIRLLAHGLHEWIATKSWSQSARFLLANPWLAGDESRNTMQLAVRLSQDWPTHEAHLFILEQAAAVDLHWAAALIVGDASVSDFVKLAIDDHRGHDAYHGAAFAVAQERRSAAAWFYAAIGAQMVELDAWAEVLAAQSGQRADESRKGDGCQTIADVGARNGWPDETIQRLQEALMSGKTAQERDGQT